MTREEAQAALALTPEYVQGPCPWCGARTLKEAATKCTPTIMMCGDYRCGVPDEAPETFGRIHVRNPAYDRLDGYLWGWRAVDLGMTDIPPEWHEDSTA